MYRMKEIGLHYQIHQRNRCASVQSKCKRSSHLKVSIFVGGPPAHSLAAVMPLPEGMSEIDLCGNNGR